MFNMVHGLGGFESALAVVRFATGLFFVFSGYHKLFNPTRHASLVATLKADKIPALWFTQYWVPGVEFIGGLAVALGFLTVPAALALAFLLAVAIATDGRKRVADWNPIDPADRVDDYLYLCETTYLALLLLFVSHGSGLYGLDYLVF